MKFLFPRHCVVCRVWAFCHHAPLRSTLMDGDGNICVLLFVQFIVLLHITYNRFGGFYRENWKRKNVPCVRRNDGEKLITRSSPFVPFRAENVVFIFSFCQSGANVAATTMAKRVERTNNLDVFLLLLLPSLRLMLIISSVLLEFS